MVLFIILHKLANFIILVRKISVCGKFNKKTINGEITNFALIR